VFKQADDASYLRTYLLVFKQALEKVISEKGTVTVMDVEDLDGSDEYYESRRKLADPTIKVEFLVTVTNAAKMGYSSSAEGYADLSNIISTKTKNGAFDSALKETAEVNNVGTLFEDIAAEGDPEISAAEIPTASPSGRSNSESSAMWGMSPAAYYGFVVFLIITLVLIVVCVPVYYIYAKKKVQTDRTTSVVSLRAAYPSGTIKFMKQPGMATQEDAL
jgi:hypothetical protein